MRPIDADALLEKIMDIPPYCGHCDGYGFLQMDMVADSVKDAPAIEQSTWISCAERLPEKEERVLVWNGKGLVQLCRYQYRYDIRKKRFRETFYTDGNKTPYTAEYGMPLPKPPKGVE